MSDGIRDAEESVRVAQMDAVGRLNVAIQRLAAKDAEIARLREELKRLREACSESMSRCRANISMVAEEEAWCFAPIRAALNPAPDHTVNSDGSVSEMKPAPEAKELGFICSVTKSPWEDCDCGWCERGPSTKKPAPEAPEQLRIICNSCKGMPMYKRDGNTITLLHDCCARYGSHPSSDRYKRHRAEAPEAPHA